MHKQTALKGTWAHDSLREITLFPLAIFSTGPVLTHNKYLGFWPGLIFLNLFYTVVECLTWIRQSAVYSLVQSLICVQLFVTLWTAACWTSLSITNSWSLPKLIESVMPSNHLILCRPLLLPPTIFPSIMVFSNESVLRIRWPKYWSFSFSISPSNEYSGLTSFRMDWLDLLVVQGTLKSLLQHHSSKASIFWHSAFFIV